MKFSLVHHDVFFIIYKKLCIVKVLLTFMEFNEVILWYMMRIVICGKSVISQWLLDCNWNMSYFIADNFPHSHDI